MLEARNITVSFDDYVAVRDISFDLEAGQWLMIAGPNGAGKSTLINAISQGIPYSGTITMDGRPLRALKQTEVAKNIGFLMQRNSVQYAYTVEDIVALGRYSYRKGFLRSEDDDCRKKVDAALEMTGLTPLRKHNAMTLSGGELQRTFLAQLFAQDPRVLILDEPANHLDPAYQKQIFALIRDWLSVPDRGVISVVHDLSLAKHFGTHALLMDRGRCVSCGTVTDALSDPRLKEAYDFDVSAWMRELSGEWAN